MFNRVRPRKVVFLFLVLQNDQAPGFFFFLETKVERKQQMHHRGLGLGTRLQNADTCVSREPKDRGLDDEATECRLCKHCGCMLNTDYI